MSRTIGLIGGMSWESSAEYYRLLNAEVRDRLGGHHNARSIMVTVDFAEIEALQRAGDWDASGRLLTDAARTLQDAGAEAVVLCTNTMHRVAAGIETVLTVPFLHIVDVTAAAITTAGLDTVALLGTRFTMEMDFYRDRMRANGIAVLIPDEPDRTLVHDVIYDELTKGQVAASSRDAYRRVIAELAGRGAQGVILGCTEITLLIGPEDSPIPVFDSTALHVRSAVDFAVS